MSISRLPEDVHGHIHSFLSFDDTINLLLTSNNMIGYVKIALRTRIMTYIDRHFDVTYNQLRSLLIDIQGCITGGALISAITYRNDYRNIYIYGNIICRDYIPSISYKCIHYDIHKTIIFLENTKIQISWSVDPLLEAVILSPFDILANTFDGNTLRIPSIHGLRNTEINATSAQSSAIAYHFVRKYGDRSYHISNPAHFIHRSEVDEATEQLDNSLLSYDRSRATYKCQEHD